MKRIRWLRVGLLFLAPFLTLTALLSAVAPAQDAPKKPAPFPRGLWANAGPDDYIDEAACVECHREPHGGFERSPHAAYVMNSKDPVDRRGCQGCHGPGGPHVANLEEPADILKHVLSYTKSRPMDAAQGCLRCHEDTMTAAHWRRTSHAHADVTCSSCHQIHQPTEAQKRQQEAKNRARLARPPLFVAAVESRRLLKGGSEAALCATCHAKEVSEFRHNFHHPVPEGRLACSDCHEIHPRRETERAAAAHTRVRAGSPGAWTETENCATCHAQTAGPFVFEHDVAGEGCGECHRPHGSHNPKLLSTFSRGLCAQCHTDKLAAHFPGRTCWQSGCHVAVHGSNSDPLLLRR